MPSLESYRPAPERLWVRYRPRHWPAAEAPWSDLARASLGRAGSAGSSLPAPPERPLDDVVYLPPVAPELEAERTALAARWARVGTPLLVQQQAGTDPGAENVTQQVWDLLPVLLGGEPEALARMPSGSAAVWPLISGLTDRPELVEEGLDRLRDAGVATVQPLALELSPATRRRLARAADPETFDRLFHGAPPSERALARRIARRGMAIFVPRPLPAGPPRLVVGRRCAGELRLAAELCRRLDRPELDVQRLLRAARWIDRADHDLAALVEDGNLEIVEWIDATGRAIVEEVVRRQHSTLVRELTAAYAGGRD